MMRRTPPIGGTRTSVKLEPEFRDHLREMAGARGLTLAALVREVVASSPAAANRASALRVRALAHAARGRQPSEILMHGDGSLGESAWGGPRPG